MYMSIWEYQIAPDAVERFEQQYGPDGGWVTLFRRAQGYRSTTLLRDRADPLRYVTIDLWESGDAHEAFQQQFAVAFAELDDACKALTQREIPVGQFTTIGDGPPLAT